MVFYDGRILSGAQTLHLSVNNLLRFGSLCHYLLFLSDSKLFALRLVSAMGSVFLTRVVIGSILVLSHINGRHAHFVTFR